MFVLPICQWNKSALETSFCFYGRFLAVYRVTKRLRETSRPSSHPTNFGFSLCYIKAFSSYMAWT